MPDFLLAPGWDALHPRLVHFPVALLTVAPLFVVAALALPLERARPYLTAALALLALGTTAAFLATSTGRAAAERAPRTPTVQSVLNEHEELAETSRNLFAGLTVALAAILFGPRIARRRPTRRATAVALVVFLLAYVPAWWILAHAAHHGGQLVHALGVRARF